MLQDQRLAVVFLESVAGYIAPTTGRIMVDGDHVSEPGPDRGMVFQQYSLFPWKTVRENVAFGPRILGRSTPEQVADMFIEISEEQVGEVARYFASQPPPEVQAQLLEVSVNSRAEALFTHGDAAAGIAPCRECHAPARGLGKARTAAPRLSAQHEAYIAKQLADFRSGARANDAGNDMATIARKLAESDIPALARYLAARPREAKP